MLEDSIIKKVVEEYGSPIYIYDKKVIIEKIKSIQAIPYPKVKIFAATMANNNLELLKIYKEHGMGVFVNSIKHMHKAKKAGFSGKEIMWTSTGMSAKQMRTAADEGTMLNLDSANQLGIYGQINPRGHVGLRINVGDMPDNETYAGVFVGEKSRIGITIDEIDEALSVAKKYALKIVGLHVYLGTQIKEIGHFVHGLRLLEELVYKFKDLEYLDLGGGFPINEGTKEPFDFEGYNRAIAAEMTNISEHYGKTLELILEPGRILAGDAGHFVTKVTEIKFRGKYNYIFVEGGSSIFPRLLFYPELLSHPHYVLGKESHGKIHSVDICGSTTYSRDFLAKASQEIPKDIQIGDLIVFKNAGSYSLYSKTDFLGIETPGEVLVDENITRLISQGEMY